MAGKALKKKVLLGLMTQSALAMLAASCQVDTAETEAEAVDEAQQAASADCTCKCLDEHSFDMCAVKMEGVDCKDWDFVRKGLTSSQCSAENGGSCTGYSIAGKTSGGKLTNCAIATK